MTGTLAAAPARAASWIGDRLRGRAIILGYHRVADTDWDPGGLVVRPDRFREHLRIVRRFGTVVPLGSIVQFLRGGRLPRRAVALSFDDGYRDNLSVLLPLLEEDHLPATVFVTTGGSGEFFWWDELAAILHPSNELPPRLELVDLEDPVHAGGRSAGLDVGTAPGERKRLQAELARRISRLEPALRARVMEALRAWAGPVCEPDEGARSLARQDIERLARSPGIEVGAHSVTHARIGELEEVDTRREVEESFESLRAVAGPTVTGFSYPHGSTSEMARRTLARAGAEYACASHAALVERRTDPMILPRLWPRDFAGPRFFRWLHARWLGL